MEALADIGRRDARIGAVAESARRNGIENIGIVGGYVRDALLGGEPRDLDVVVEGLTPGRPRPCRQVGRYCREGVGGSAPTRSRCRTSTWPPRGRRPTRSRRRCPRLPRARSARTWPAGTSL